ncbi:hypothetical protein WICMUC_005144 [Wickerhamomyces mucosus]|uniref:Uncharacterized protein n=1 Tax=Wickerhamomyces mucosus TaxID=1378264 RepID=A0A9P8PA26_9ASCO|nr:hypothetical protein WICMUC_005144 [Wickerhamomyces mucosus]
MEIPGYYFDSIKRKYFKIDSSNTNYNKDNLRNLKFKDQQLQKKLKLLYKIKDNNLEILSIKNKFNNRLNSNFNLINYQLQNYKLVNTQNFYNRNLQKIISKDNSIYLSNNSEIFELNSNLNLIYSSSINNDLILRNFDKLDKFFVKIWYGLNQELGKLDIINSNQLIKSFHSNRYENYNNFHIDNQNQIIIVGNKGLNFIDFTKDNLIKFKTDDILSITGDNQKDLYLGFRNGLLSQFDYRSFKLNKLSINFKSAIINLQDLNLNEILISSIDGELSKFDKRYFKKPLIKFNSLLKINDIFANNLTLNKDIIILQNNQMVEIFNINNSIPLKIIESDNVKFNSHVLINQDLNLKILNDKNQLLTYE